MSNRSSWQSLAGWLRLGLVLMSLSALLPARAQAVIEAVSSAMQGGVEVVRIDLSQPLTAAPTGFAIQSPARIALDFPGVASALTQPTVEVNQGNVRSISVAQAGDRSRVVLNLKQAATYKTQLEGKTLLVILEPTVAVAPTRTTPTPAASAGATGQALKDVDFRRGLDGVGRIVVTLPNAQIGVGLQQQGQALIAEFPGATLPEGLRRRMDVTDFGTPVQTVTTFQVADRVRMVIEPKGQWEHSAYQSDEQFVIEVKPLKVDPNKLSPGPGYTGQKLSLNFQNIEVRSLLQVIADFTNFNVVTSDTVTGSVTLRLQDVPWDQALDIILQAKGLGVRKAGNVLWIAPKDEIIAKEKLERESNVALESLEPLNTQSYQLNYAKALDVQRGLIGGAPMPGGAGGGGGASSRILSSRGSVIAESRTNQLFITDVASKQEQIRQLIAKIDVPVRQVLIEARIVEASDSFGKSLGARLGGGSTGQIATTPTGGEVRGALGSYLNPETNKLIVTPGFNTNFVNLASTGALGFGNPGAFAFSIFSPDRSNFLNLEISALEADGKGKVVASPRVVTADKIKAIIEQGTELPYQMASASGATSVAFRKANLKLEVTPQITPEGGVILTLDVTKDSVGQSTPAGFAIDTKHISTEVLVENGGTVMIGGIYSEESTDTEAKVPFFGDLPFLGALFRTKATSRAKKELLVFITPKTIAERAAVR